MRSIFKQKSFRDNTYVDNLIVGPRTLKAWFKVEAGIMEDTKFPLQKWGTKFEELDGEDMPNPSKIVGHN